MRSIIEAAFCAALIVAASAAQAQQPAASSSPASKALEAANQKMMQDMMVPMSGDADQDFVAAMLPHHQGAVDMAKIELQYGHDPELRRLAMGIIRAQDKEIAQMKAWQALHPKKS